MSTYLGTEYPPLISKRPPHMSDEDYEIYQQWWPRVSKPVLRTWYDVGVGEGSPDAITPGDGINYKRMWTRITQKRIDLLAETPNQLWLVELRHAATSNAVGRLLQYLLLWDRDPVIKKPVQLFLVTNFNDPELDDLCRANRIIYNWV